MLLKHNTAINFIFGIHPASGGKRFPSTFYICKKEGLYSSFGIAAPRKRLKNIYRTLNYVLTLNGITGYTLYFIFVVNSNITWPKSTSPSIVILCFASSFEIFFSNILQAVSAFITIFEE